MRFKLNSIIGIVVALALPATAECQEKASAPAMHESGRLIHHIPPNMTLIEHGDSLFVVTKHTSSDESDSTLFLFRGDSAVRIMPGPLRALSKGEADKLHHVVDEVKLIEKGDDELRSILH
jgi:hypothetical protein